MKNIEIAKVIKWHELNASMNIFRAMIKTKRHHFVLLVPDVHMDTRKFTQAEIDSEEAYHANAYKTGENEFIITLYNPRYSLISNIPQGTLVKIFDYKPIGTTHE